jgi:outer membrane lipopolysaccharide assembly protein LptE/RlpB
VLVYGLVLGASSVVSPTDAEVDRVPFPRPDVVDLTLVVEVSVYLPDPGCPTDADVSISILCDSENSTVTELSRAVVLDELRDEVIASVLVRIHSHYIT